MKVQQAEKIDKCFELYTESKYQQSAYGDLTLKVRFLNSRKREKTVSE